MPFKDYAAKLEYQRKYDTAHRAHKAAMNRAWLQTEEGKASHARSVARWRAKNLDKARKIARESMARVRDRRTLAELEAIKAEKKAAQAAAKARGYTGKLSPDGF
jgi:hypothetical protein